MNTLKKKILRHFTAYCGRSVKISSQMRVRVDGVTMRKGACLQMTDRQNGLDNKKSSSWRMPWWTIPAAYLLMEVFAFAFLGDGGNWWPLAFGVLWACILTGLVRALPAMAGRIVFGITYFLFAAYAAVQTGYYNLFGQMMWITEFRYASEGSEFFSVLLQYPLHWWLFVVGSLALGAVIVWKFPRRVRQWQRSVIAALVAAIAVVSAVLLPEAVFVHDRQVQYAGSDYGRAQSAEAAYTNMFNAHRLYKVCGVYQTAVKDVYRDWIYPLLPGYASAQAEAVEKIDSYFAERGEAQDNEMTGIFAGKNVVFVLMESMDDWALNQHTPTINRLMDEGINFTNFYTPPYGGVRTFNTEFCANTGSFLSSQGGYAFDYVTNDYRQSLASLLTGQGYSAKVYHYNTPNFYSRGVFSPAMGYEEYVSYEDYVTEQTKRDLYDDQFLFDNDRVSESFFREGQKLNFIITRSAHLSYKYNEVLSYWGLQKYPEYRGMTGHQEEDCMYLKARLVDDMFARLLEELEAHGELENTVIVAFTDHYTYGINDEEMMLERSGVDDLLLLEKTPCFIWSADGPALEVEKTLNTSDLLPTVLNLLGVDSPYHYLGQDAFDERYAGYALFPNGSWVSGGIAYNVKNDRVMILEESKAATDEFMAQMAQTLNRYVYINNLILETDYYAQK